MNVFSEKRTELLQTLVSLSAFTMTEKGCLRSELCLSIEDENRLFLLEEWDTRKDLVSHLKSGHFKVLRGAMNLLKDPWEMKLQTILDSPIEFNTL